MCLNYNAIATVKGREETSNECQEDRNSVQRKHTVTTKSDNSPTGTFKSHKTSLQMNSVERGLQGQQLVCKFIVSSPFKMQNF